eukprot:4124569-Alexandrium_andersonii.AAC.1
MSASLVGSEMCIRDRPPTGHHTSGVDPCARRLRAPRNGAPTCFVGALSVSYTHLTLPTICSV